MKIEKTAKETRFYNTQPLENIKEREVELQQKKNKKTRQSSKMKTPSQMTQKLLC